MRIYKVIEHKAICVKCGTRAKERIYLDKAYACDNCKEKLLIEVLEETMTGKGVFGVWDFGEMDIVKVDEFLCLEVGGIVEIVRNNFIQRLPDR